jgi:hypothetical protein
MLSIAPRRQTQGKIEHYHRSMKAIVKLNTSCFPPDPEQAITDFVDSYNHERYHESLDNVTPADVYFGRQQEVLTQHEIIQQRTLQQRRRHQLRLQEHAIWHGTQASILFPGLLSHSFWRFTIHCRSIR